MGYTPQPGDDLARPPKVVDLFGFRNFERGAAVICSVFPFEPFNSSIPGAPSFLIPACPPGKPYVKIVVRDIDFTIDKGDVEGTYLLLRATARDIALDRVRDCFNMGAFVCEGMEPTEDELAAARERMKKYFRDKLREGDEIYRWTRDPGKISIHSRYAAQLFGQDKDWNSAVEEQKHCPNCRRGMSMAAVRCPHCEFIVDWQAAARGGLLNETQLRMAIANSWLPADLKLEEASFPPGPGGSMPDEDLGEDAVTEEEARKMPTPRMTGTAAAAARAGATRIQHSNRKPDFSE